MNAPIRPKGVTQLFQSLRAGVVPRTGQHLIQVGRIREIETLVSDMVRGRWRFVVPPGHRRIWRG